MLILIAGITGNIGLHAARHALAIGHQVRGLGRSPDKLDPNVRQQLESFITSSSYSDITALDRAAFGVDAVICAYGGLPELHLDAQLLLFRAVERAGVKRYLAASWNYDWRKIPFESEPIYDAARMFHSQVSITSNVKPLHIFSGMLVDVFFNRGGDKGFLPKDCGVWDPIEKSMDVWGTGKEMWFFTTEEDAGSFGVEAVTSPDAEKGGFVSVCSFSHSLEEIKAIYEQVRGVTVIMKKRGMASDLYALSVAGQKKDGRGGFWNWHRYEFHANCVSGVWNLENLQNDRFPKVKATSLEEYLKTNHDI
ncbi:hypothetical protein H2198_002020 [Neophaeococcomyces mojaviensis]|uniref:Uncharacterized protein n=1 Tax=Neophaeococcomyces mojaviensis TaxID=3383035 RepID=A0ACC3AF77_9EURO|nr:hypothetical protein H2198_002020 [Knufia sp. JES_112]